MRTQLMELAPSLTLPRSAGEGTGIEVRTFQLRPLPCKAGEGQGGGTFRSTGANL
jgi:hypothetical protein